MNQSSKISIVQLLLGEPIVIAKNLTVFHPIMKDIAILGYSRFGALISVWNLTRSELVLEENDETWNLSDFEVWRECILYNPNLRDVFKESVLFFMHKTVEFLPMQRSIFIGELESGIELSEELFSEIQTVINIVTRQKEDIKKKNAPRSKKAEEIAEKIRAGEEKIANLKKSKGIDPLASQITALTVHSHKTFDDIFNMTIIQFEVMLEKTVAIENYNISAMLSPYMDKKHKTKNKHWLDE